MRWLLIVILTGQLGTDVGVDITEFTSERACQAALKAVRASFGPFDAPHLECVKYNKYED